LGIGTEGQVVTLDSHGFTNKPTLFKLCRNHKAVFQTLRGRSAEFISTVSALRGRDS
jgi:hypothetical protein